VHAEDHVHAGVRSLAWLDGALLGMCKVVLWIERILHVCFLGTLGMSHIFSVTLKFRSA